MSLFNAYRNYYEQDRKEALFEEIKRYDWHNYRDELNEVRKLQRPTIFAAHKLSTSGSTGIQKYYEFGPNWLYWLLALETEVKNPNNYPVLVLTENYDYLNNRAMLEGGAGLDWHAMEPYGVSLYRIDFRKPFDGFYKFLNAYGPFAIQTTPKCILSLGKNEEFINVIKKSGSALNTTNYEPFYDTPLFVNDNNITWDSGFAFYTCEVGARHALPTFCMVDGVCHSLINLRHPSGSSADYIRLKDRILCGCGKYRVEFDFVPHYKTQPIVDGRLLYDVSIAKKLRGSYTNMQFIKVVNHIVCVYEGSMVDEDLLRSFGVDTFMADSYCCTSLSHYKMAAFYDITHQSNKCIKQRKNK